jgi:hypothetical protein
MLCVKTEVAIHKVVWKSTLRSRFFVPIGKIQQLNTWKNFISNANFKIRTTKMLVAAVVAY